MKISGFSTLFNFIYLFMFFLYLIITIFQPIVNITGMEEIKLISFHYNIDFDEI